MHVGCCEVSKVTGRQASELTADLLEWGDDVLLSCPWNGRPCCSELCQVPSELTGLKNAVCCICVSLSYHCPPPSYHRKRVIETPTADGWLHVITRDLFISSILNHLLNRKRCQIWWCMDKVELRPTVVPVLTVVLHKAEITPQLCLLAPAPVIPSKTWKIFYAPQCSYAAHPT